MARDTAHPDTILARIAELRARLVDTEAPERIRALKREITKAADTRLRCATACSSLSGLHGSAEDLELALENERAHQRALQRAQQGIAGAVEAARPEIHEIVDELAKAAAAVGQLLRDLGNHVANTAGRSNPTAGIWQAADASARGLAMLATTVRPQK